MTFNLAQRGSSSRDGPRCVWELWKAHKDECYRNQVQRAHRSPGDLVRIQILIQAVWAWDSAFLTGLGDAQAADPKTTLRRKDLEGTYNRIKTNMIVFPAPLLFKSPDFLNFTHMLITSLLHNNTVNLKKERKRRGKMHQACWSNTTVSYSLLSCQWK